MAVWQDLDQNGVIQAANENQQTTFGASSVVALLNSQAILSVEGDLSLIHI